MNPNAPPGTRNVSGLLRLKCDDVGTTASLGGQGPERVLSARLRGAVAAAPGTQGESRRLQHARSGQAGQGGTAG
eukprot:8286776-Alexandrium_andersonii.AAC.1